jgi:hypothetical protein
MASNLAGDICVGQHSVCIVRAAVLKPNCRPLGGVDSGFVSAGIITATASPQLREGQTFEPETGCGRIAWTYEQPDQIRSFDVSGELTFFDHEMMEILFGGELIVGGSQSDFSGEVIGWAAPNYTDDPPPPIYLEFITLTAAEGLGNCQASVEDSVPSAVGHIFGKVRLAPGDRTFAAEAATVAFSGNAVANPNLFDGPWNDWPGTDPIPNSPYVQVSYSLDEYEAIADLAACGYQTLPSGS